MFFEAADRGPCQRQKAELEAVTAIVCATLNFFLQRADLFQLFQNPK